MMNNSQLKERIRDLKDQYPLHVTIFKNDPQVIFLNTDDPVDNSKCFCLLLLGGGGRPLALLQIGPRYKEGTLLLLWLTHIEHYCQLLTIIVSIKTHLVPSNCELLIASHIVRNSSLALTWRLRRVSHSDNN